MTLSRIALLFPAIAVAVFSFHTNAADQKVLGGPFTAYFGASDTSSAVGEPAVQGGTPAKPADYSASFFAISEMGSCTAALIAPTVLLTAAHCVVNGQQVTIRKGGQVYYGTCDRAPGYDPADPAKQTSDWALCLSVGPIPATAYERINLNPAKLAAAQPVTVTGVGCVAADRLNASDGTFRVGTGKIASIGKDNGDIAVNGDVASGALCPADSGGPVFVNIGAGAAAKRYIAGINFRIETGADGMPSKTFHLASTSTPAAVDFLKTWTAAHNIAKICGRDDDAPGCR